MRKTFRRFLENVVSLHRKRRTKVNKGYDNEAAPCVSPSKNQLIKMSKCVHPFHYASATSG